MNKKALVLSLLGLISLSSLHAFNWSALKDKAPSFIYRNPGLLVGSACMVGLGIFNRCLKNQNRELTALNDVLARQNGGYFDLLKSLSHQSK